MWWLSMKPEQVNILLNLLGIILGGGALGVVLTHYRGMRTLDNAKEADIRDHYAGEVKELRERNVRLVSANPRSRRSGASPRRDRC